jgi:uncharacterized protein (DUF427 family)
MKAIVPKEGQESVWDYPRPPRVEETSQKIRVVFEGVTIADTTHAKRLLETSHPPTYYIPPEDIATQYLIPSDSQSFCEWKGTARYYHLQIGDKRVLDVAWYYPKPTGDYTRLVFHMAFYAQKMSACFVDEEQARAQPGKFYGGWVTSNIVGPFKGEPGTEGW